MSKKIASRFGTYLSLNLIVFSVLYTWGIITLKNIITDMFVPLIVFYRSLIVTIGLNLAAFIYIKINKIELDKFL
ncbi:hypothetical protein QT06_C0001G0136 [archaeon GW2011_AR15]|nr:hypothetical protein QT06_C0001G0136 [archaeon GW2011_AR15]